MNREECLRILREHLDRVTHGHSESLAEGRFDDLRALAIIVAPEDPYALLGVHFIYPTGEAYDEMNKAVNEIIENLDAPGALIVGFGEAQVEGSSAPSEAILYSLLTPGYTEGYVVIYDGDSGRILDRSGRLTGTTFAPGITAFKRH